MSHSDLYECSRAKHMTGVFLASCSLLVGKYDT